MPIAAIQMLCKLAFFALLALVACAAECSPVRHRRPAKFFRSDTIIDKGPQVTSRQWHGINAEGGLQDLTGVYAGTWKRMDSLSDAPDQLTEATSSSSSSSSGHDSQLPPMLTSSSSGRVMLRLTAGPPAAGEELATIEGVLRLSEGSLVSGPGVKHLDVSGITKLGPDGLQAVQAVAKPQHTVYNTGSSSSSSSSSAMEGDSATSGSSKLTSGWLRGRHQRQHQRQPQQHSVKEQGWLRGHKLLRLLHSKVRHGPLGLPADSSGTLGGTSTSSSTYTASSDAGNDLNSEATPHRRLSEQDDGRDVNCRFRLELAVTQVNSAGGETATVSTAGASRAIKSAAEPPQVMTAQQQQQQRQQDQQLDPGDGEVVSDESSSGLFALYSMRWQHAAGLEHLLGQQQHQQRQQAVTSSAPYRGLKSLSIGSPTSAGVATAEFLTALQPGPQVTGAAPTLAAAAAASVAVAAAAAEYVVRTAEEAVDQQSGSAVTAAAHLSAHSSDVMEVDDLQLPAADVVAAAAAVLKAAAAKSATAEDKWGMTGSSRGSPARSLQSRDVPGLPEASEPIQTESQSTAATDAAEPPAPDVAEVQQHRMMIAEDDQPADDLTQQQAQPTPQQSQQQPASSSSSSSSPVPQSLIDYWMLPCSHPQQLHNLRCQYQQHRQHYWQQHMVIQGLLLSENCNASWSITAVALAPGGLERQAMCYAIVALLLCLAQVVLLRRQAKVVQASPAAALKMSLLGVCAGSQLDACLSMAHLAAALAAPDVSLPLLVVAAAQFALFAGADMTLLLHVWRAHTSNSRRQQQRQQQPLDQGLNLFISSTGSTATLEAGMPPVSHEAAATLAGFHPQHWSAAVAAAASAVAAQLQEQAEGLREFAGSSSGSSLIDVLLSGMVQLLTGQTLLLLYVRFYLVLLAVTLISWVLASQIPLLLLLAYSFWLPQITYNILHSTRQAIVPAYVIAASTARVLLPIYLLSCPGNMLQLAPQSWLAVGLVVWLGLQVLLLLLQHYVGPHVCLPAAWVPERYNYHRHELPWQFKQQIAELRKLGYTQQQQQQQQQQVLVQPSSAASGNGLCRCTRCSTGGVSQPAPAAAPPVANLQQQHWTCVTGPAVPDSAASCRCHCSCGTAPSTLQAAAAARRRGSDSSSNSCWGSFSGDSSSSSSSNDWEVTQQQHSARASWPAVAGPPVGMPSSSNQNTWQQHHQQQQQRMTWYPEIHPSSDAYYITVLGATATVAAAGIAQQHRPQAVAAEPQHLSHHTHNHMHQSLIQHHHHAPHVRLIHQMPSPPPASFVAPFNSAAAAAAAAAAAGSSVSILPGQHSTTNCCQAAQSYQSWLNQADDVFHDVMEGYDALTGQGVVECVICMAGVELLPVSGRCVTPCGHFYHPDCLASWMEVKAECPTCRGPLPPL